MKRELAIHFIFLFSLLIFVSLVRNWVNLAYFSFWIGGLLGTVLPDLDHLIYVYLLKPKDSTSQEVSSLVSQRKYVRVFELLSNTKKERNNLIFHTLYFQIIFLVLTFFVISSSANLFAIGLVLGFSLHLLVDQLVDFFDFGNLDNWFLKIYPDLEKEKQTFYWAIIFVLFLLTAFVF